MEYEFLPQAEVEMEEAAEYYDQQQEGLGDRFLGEVRRTVERIQVFPNAWPKLSRRSRRCRLNRFPYGVVYMVRGDKIVITAVMHLHRRPGYWRHREQ